MIRVARRSYKLLNVGVRVDLEGSLEGLKREKAASSKISR